MSQFPQPPHHWNFQGGSTKGVQHAYLNGRLKAINTSSSHDALLEATKTALRALPRFHKAKDAQLEFAIAQMTRRLQSADLTINIDARSWFRTENIYDSYAQMYQKAMRASRDGQMILTDQKNNPARVRAGIDDNVTFPKDWGMKTTWLGQEGFRYANNPPPLPQQRGLSPAHTRNRLMQKMSPGQLRGVELQQGDQVVQGFVTDNQQFDPKTKQVFAALNYGRRPHGSSTYYGWSHMVLHDRFKFNALYYAGDTFNALLPKYKLTPEHQITYPLLGLIYDKGRDPMRAGLLKSCLDNATLPSTSDKELLLEGHLFESFKFPGNIKTLYISQMDLPANDPDRGELIRTIYGNARTFAQRHGAQIVFMD
jgi:hypothetical protein